MVINKTIKNILITGGAGFIGGNLIRKLISETNSNIFNIDYMGYASDKTSIESFNKFKDRFQHFNINLNDLKNVRISLNESKPDLIIHLAAESHVDRSIDSPQDFLQSNIIGTFNLLRASHEYYENLSTIKKNIFKFHHVSTDEVFGSLGNSGKFNEDSRYDPRSPYSATKASSDHLVRAWHHSYGLPTLITNCSNNYGPYQFPEKLIPLTIFKALEGQKIPIYGSGENIRDWINVEDHIDALILVAQKGRIGATYCIGSNSEKKNIEIVEMICDYLDKKVPKKDYTYSSQITFVEDRPGHDFRYALNTDLIRSELGWEPKINFKYGLEKTIDWYLNNKDWVKQSKKVSGYNLNRLGLCDK